ncbi:MAG: hypothetical protein JO130_18275 [Solirubrobacterales bacterium]|nr:hypothetical protein [Solirubrobacterales bacterium]
MVRRAAERRIARRRRRRRARRASVAALVLALGAVVAVVVGAGEHATVRARPDLGRGRSQLAGRGARTPSGVRAAHRGALSVGREPVDALPFAPNPADRIPGPLAVPSMYADGLPCSTGCRPYGALTGWPLKPFHAEHGVRAGFNELRPDSLHVGIDIQARDGAAVYAVQPGVATVLTAVGPNARVQVGNYVYWHIAPSVRTGELVRPFHTVLGHVLPDYGHIAFSELDLAGGYVNPLRPGGSVLRPYVDHAHPEIARPEVSADGQVVAAVYSPQTFVQRTTYPTPVLAPAALAYRLETPAGTRMTPLEWTFRGTHLLPFVQRRLIYAPGAHAPGFWCFARRPLCVPHWLFRVAGGTTPPLPATLVPGRYRLTIYAWNWTDNVTALDTMVRRTATGWRPIGHFPAALSNDPGYGTTPLAAPSPLPSP